jgi:uncharacterized protein (TIGR03435 family)
VLIVDSADNKPTANPPGVAEAFPVAAPPTEFEVASVKQVDSQPAAGMPVPIRLQMQPGGRLNYENVPMQLLISRAFNANNPDQIVGLPQWANSNRYDIIAKTATTDASAAPLDAEAIAPLLRGLLAERFKLKFHTEERPVNAYALVAAKPKMKKADPANRTSCKNGDAPPGSPPATRVLTCRNISMDEFADKLQNMARELAWPIPNSTELEGRWDFTLSYSMMAGNAPMRNPADTSGGTAQPAAADPNSGFTIFEALEKQLGLKLELRKRPEQVFVIDHLEEKPTEN